eukprot:Hpha_TRINITY_DN21376_c0_g1::TRINITY_DN21376_c0_g1_i1::g.192605::m.192605
MKKGKKAMGETRAAVRLWNCADVFNDEAVRRLLRSAEVEKKLADGGIVWAVEEEGDARRFTGRGWLHFNCPEAAGDFVSAFDVLGDRAGEAAAANGGLPLCCADAKAGAVKAIAGQRCLRCGGEGHFGRDCAAFVAAERRKKWFRDCVRKARQRAMEGRRRRALERL